MSELNCHEELIVEKTASDGKTYNTKQYNLSAITAVGYKVNSEKAVQFSKWAALGVIKKKR